MTGPEYQARAMEHAPQTSDEILRAAAGFSDHGIAGIPQANAAVSSGLQSHVHVDAPTGRPSEFRKLIGGEHQ